MIYLALIALTTLAANGARQLRYIAVGLAAVTATATVIGASVATVPELAVSGCAGLVAAGAAAFYFRLRSRQLGS